jgi:hypothetical protein
MNNVVIGLVSFTAVFLILHVTGKLSGKWSTDRDEYEEKDTLGKGCVIWLIIGAIACMCYGLGTLMSHFIGI